MGRNRKNQTEATYDSATAIAAADALRANATRFTDSLSPFGEGQDEIIARLGELIAAVVSLSFALELYLKALNILVGRHPPEDHHLWTLFKGLPREVKESITDNYERLDSSEPGLLAAIVLYRRLTPHDWSEGDGELDESERRHDLKSVLLRSSNTFATWRYLHEGTLDEPVVTHRFEFKRLDLICTIVRAHAAAQWKDRREAV